MNVDRASMGDRGGSIGIPLFTRGLGVNVAQAAEACAGVDSSAWSVQDRISGVEWDVKNKMVVATGGWEFFPVSALWRAVSRRLRVQGRYPGYLEDFVEAVMVFSHDR